ncbi:MAG: selenide, water dikinase SelD [Bacteroidetes bacterium]|nr:selenide, water dikinase SelD [Bacteroidota bacterium]
MLKKLKVKLTSFSHGAGCGCKISPQLLEEIIGKNNSKKLFKELIVGNSTKDDAAVYDLKNGTALISTTDFFTPIVDDPFLFGQIASANAISDVYAMGGKPIFALAILGWPISKLPVEVAAKVIEGAKNICEKINIPLAGGHTIDTIEPIFGLAVNGICDLKNIKKNSTANIGDQIYLTKKIGVGILSTAEKKGIISEKDKLLAHRSMLKLNSFGETLGNLDFITSMTDVTGFGLAGHLIEICEGSKKSAIIYENKIPLICDLNKYIKQNSIPGGSNRNWQSYGNKISPISQMCQTIISDPQTNGGLLFTIKKEKETEFLKFVKSSNSIKQLITLCKIGEIIELQEKSIIVK